MTDSKFLCAGLGADVTGQGVTAESSCLCVEAAEADTTHQLPGLPNPQLFAWSWPSERQNFSISFRQNLSEEEDDLHSLIDSIKGRHWLPIINPPFQR